MHWTWSELAWARGWGKDFGERTGATYSSVPIFHTSKRIDGLYNLLLITPNPETGLSNGEKAWMEIKQK